MLSSWCGLGLHHADFWDVTLREYDLITGGKIKAKDQEFKAWRILNQELGILVQYAFHDPKKMPDFTKDKNAPAQRPIAGKRGADLLRAHLNRLYYDGQKGK